MYYGCTFHYLVFLHLGRLENKGKMLHNVGFFGIHLGKLWAAFNLCFLELLDIVYMHTSF